METGKCVKFVGPDGSEYSATVAHVWETRQAWKPLLNLAVNPAVEDGRPFLYSRARPNVYTSVPHRSQVVGATGYYWEEID